MNKIRDLLNKALLEKVCEKHAVAVVIETVSHNYILGWNGPPTRGIPHDGCLRAGYPSGEGMELCTGIHAEIKGISHAAQAGYVLGGGTIHMNEWFPCSTCAGAIVEAGIEKLVTPDEIYQDKANHILLPKLQNQSYNFELAEKFVREANIRIVVDPSIRL